MAASKQPRRSQFTCDLGIELSDLNYLCSHVSLASKGLHELNDTGGGGQTSPIDFVSSTEVKIMIRCCRVTHHCRRSRSCPGPPCRRRRGASCAPPSGWRGVGRRPFGCIAGREDNNGSASQRTIRAERGASIGHGKTLAVQQRLTWHNIRKSSLYLLLRSNNEVELLYTPYFPNI